MRLALLGAAAFAALAMFASDPASARFPAQPIAAPSLVDNVACTVRQVRTVRPGGQVVFRTVRTCTPEPVCRTVKTRKVRPNGKVVVTTERRCS
ncbi:MAG TPA: hypothetical protein VHL98_09330 [Microvirga sp.]|jgi:hypothetical protein|nr:hypothetical protein [Microvirga sp.]